MNSDGREFHLRNRRDEGGVTAAERSRVEQGGVKSLVVGLVEFVDDFSLDIRMKDLDVELELGGIAFDPLVGPGRVIGPKISVWTLPRMFMPAP